MSNWEKNIAKNRSWWGHHYKLKNAEEIRSEEFELKRDKKTKDEQELIDEFSLKYLHEEINEGKVPTELEFYFGGENKNFFLKCLTLDLDDKNKNFIDFIASEIGEEIFLQSKLSIYLKTGNVYCENLNINESIYDFFNNNRTRQKKLSMRHSALMIPFQVTWWKFLTTTVLATLIDLRCYQIKM